MKSLPETKTDILLPKKCKMSFLPFLFGLFYDFIKNLIVRFMYEDDMSPTLFSSSNNYNFVFSDKKIQIPKILPTWVFVALKCQQNFEILQLVWTLAPNKF